MDNNNKQKFAEVRQELKDFYSHASDITPDRPSITKAERILGNRNVLAFDVVQLTLQVFKTTHHNLGVTRPSEFYAKNREDVSEAIVSALERAAEKS